MSGTVSTRMPPLDYDAEGTTTPRQSSSSQRSAAVEDAPLGTLQELARLRETLSLQESRKSAMLSEREALQSELGAARLAAAARESANAQLRAEMEGAQAEAAAAADELYELSRARDKFELQVVELQEAAQRAAQRVESAAAGGEQQRAAAAALEAAVLQSKRATDDVAVGKELALASCRTGLAALAARATALQAERAALRGVVCELAEHGAANQRQLGGLLGALAGRARDELSPDGKTGAAAHAAAQTQCAKLLSQLAERDAEVAALGEQLEKERRERRAAAAAEAQQAAQLRGANDSLRAANGVLQEKALVQVAKVNAMLSSLEEREQASMAEFAKMSDLKARLDERERALR